MQLSSPAFDNDQEMAQKFGKKIENVSPPLAWQDAPHGTKSFALAMVDLDSHNYAHWMVVGIGANVTELKEGAANNHHMPPGSHELKPYADPYPPSGTHAYEFTLYALNIDGLDLPTKVTSEMFTSAAKKNSLATAKLVGKFKKIRKS